VATLKDVARESGLGLGTVSRALSGHPRVRPETRKQVEAAARKLGYQSNGLARALRQSHSNTVGLIIPDLENDFYTTAASIVQSVLAAEGYRLVLCCSNNIPEVDAELLASLAESRVDGIIHVPCTADGSAELRRRNPGPPVVEYARRSVGDSVDSVIGDDERGSAVLVDHLVGLGHRRIAMIAGPAELSTTAARVGGFRQACRDQRLLKRDCPILYGPAYDVRSGANATEEILRDWPQVTAIFASSSRSALGSLKAMATRGVRVPDDMSVVAFLNPRWFDVSCPPLTTYELPLTEMGAMAARLLLERIRKPSAAGEGVPNIVRLQGKFVQRASTAVPREVDALGNRASETVSGHRHSPTRIRRGL
jgi:LacI family transcriptional regulator